MSVIGYCRTSTQDQNLDLQLDALKAAGVERVFEDRASGARLDRPGLADCLAYVRAGDTLVVWKLDRLGRSLSHLLKIADELQERGVDLVITTLGVDTRTPAGRMLYSLLGAIAEFERELIRERVSAGLEAARARGRVGGRPRALTDRQARTAREMYAERGEDGKRLHTVAQIAAEVGCGRSTVYRYLSTYERDNRHSRNGD